MIVSLFLFPDYRIFVLSKNAMETPFINLHTHVKASQPGIVNIVNIEWDQTVPETGFYSVGIHPWALDPHDLDPKTALAVLREKAQNSAVVAIGETGIDKCHPTSLLQQTALFEQHVSLSEQVGKPLIIHAVRSYGEVLSVHKKHRPDQAWIIHGFNGNTETADQLTRDGILLSIGKDLLHAETKIHKSLKYISLENIFFETDVSDSTIVEIYETAASLLGFSIDGLKERIFANFARCFKN